jgi:uncharacterized MAPEG superfamily protein
MSIPVWVLLAFAIWTLISLLATIGVYRWSRILTGRATLAEWRADVPQGNEWYQRAMRAHMNCVENLPVYSAIVVALVATQIHGRIIDILALLLIAARICQTSIHVGLKQTDLVVGIRFTFFLIQIISMIVMVAIIIINQ